MKRLIVIASLTLGVSAPVRAQDRSGDPELLRPSFGGSAAGSFELPHAARQGTAYWGSQLAWTQDALVLYEWGAPAGSVIRDRLTLSVGGGYDLGKALSVDVSAPLVGQWGGDFDELRADGVHQGDLGLGASLRLAASDHHRLAARAEVLVPVGAKSAWVTDGRKRVTLWAMSSSDIGPLEVGGRVGLRLHAATEQALALGHELRLEPVLRLHTSERSAIWTHLGTRWTEADGLLVSVEPVAGTSLRLRPHGWLDIGGGRGLSAGFGTSTARVFAGWRVVVAPTVPERQSILVDEELDLRWLRDEDLPEDEPQRVLTEEPAPVPWLSLGDRVQFEQNSARLTDGGLQAVREVARQLEAHPEVLHLVAEGHASPEGAEAWNWQLSQDRAATVYTTLVDLGIAPTRVSYRGLGEREPLFPGPSEEQLAPSRRVVFHIIAQACEPGSGAQP